MVCFAAPFEMGTSGTPMAWVCAEDTEAVHCVLRQMPASPPAGVSQGAGIQEEKNVLETAFPLHASLRPRHAAVETFQAGRDSGWHGDVGKPRDGTADPKPGDGRSCQHLPRKLPPLSQREADSGWAMGGPERSGRPCRCRCRRKNGVFCISQEHLSEAESKPGSRWTGDSQAPA